MRLDPCDLNWSRLDARWHTKTLYTIPSSPLINVQFAGLCFLRKHKLSVLQSFHRYFWNSVSSDTALIPAIIQYRYGAPCNQHTAFLLRCCLLSKGFLFDSDWRCLDEYMFFFVCFSLFFPSTIPSRACLILEFSSCCAGICSLCSLMPSLLQHAVSGGSVFCCCSFYCFVQKYKAEGVKGMFLTVCKEGTKSYLFQNYFLILINS